MGRLTLNVLLSFAQFEREVTGERIRDKIAASKRKGMWMGGNLPLGYDVQNWQLVINEAEAETVRYIYRRYTEVGTVSALQADLKQRGIVSKVWTSTTGNVREGVGYSRAHCTTCFETRSTWVGLRTKMNLMTASTCQLSTRLCGIRCRAVSPRTGLDWTG